jgi:hypothetical protein
MSLPARWRDMKNAGDHAPSHGGTGSASEGAAPRRPLWLAAVGAVALLIHLPTLRTPHILDDYTQLAMTQGTYPSHPGPFALYDFINDSNRVSLIERGILPWWSNPRMVLRFLRPLPSGLIWVDHRVLGASAFLGHVHSLLWWMATCLAVYLLLRGLFSERVARLAAIVFVLAPCHALSLAWLANREEFVSAALGTAALARHARWREGRGARDGWASLGLFSVAMLAGEYTLCFAGYVIGIEAVRTRDSVWRRVLGVGCFALPAFVYVALHQALHYGAHGMGYYTDPLRDFGAYARFAPRRFSVLLGAAWLGVEDTAWATEAVWKVTLLGIGTVAVLAVPVRRVFGHLDALTRQRAGWLLIGSVLSLAPVMAVEPAARLLIVPMVGVSAVVALIIDHSWFPTTPQARRGTAELTGLVALVLAFAHFIRAPLDTWLVGAVSRSSALDFERRMGWLREHAEGKSTVVVLRANVPQSIYFAPMMLRSVQTPVLALSFDSGTSLLLRTSAREIDLVASRRPLFSVGPNNLFRGSDVPLHVGDRVQLSTLRATVLQLNADGTPSRLRFAFDRELDDPSFLWIVERPGRFEEQPLPAPGYGLPLEM